MSPPTGEKGFKFNETFPQQRSSHTDFDDAYIMYGVSDVCKRGRPGSCSEQDSLHHSESYDTYVKCLSVSEAIKHGAEKGNEEIKLLMFTGVWSTPVSEQIHISSVI